MTATDAINGFDFHCHVDLFPDPPAVIEQCEKERIAVLAVTTTPRAWAQNRDWTKSSALVHASVGLHPELVGQRYAEADLLERLIGECRLVGEVGLDGSPQHRKSYDRQKLVFSRALTAAQAHGGRVLTIHSRRAARDVIDLIDQHCDPGDVLCILHWFSGSAAQAKRAIESGCYFSVNTAMLRHERGRSLVQGLPKERLLTETDAPFMKVNGGPSQPSNAIEILGELSALFGEPHDRLLSQITINAQRVYSFAGIKIENAGGA